MKPLTKIALGRTGIERQFAPQSAQAKPPKATIVRLANELTTKAAAVKKSRAKNDKYRTYMRDYLRKKRQKAKPT